MARQPCVAHGGRSLVLAAAALLRRAPRRGPATPAAPVGDGNGGVELTKLGDFDAPVYIATPPAGQPQAALRGRAGRRDPRDRATARCSSRPFLDICRPVSTGGERGLLSIAFDPGYARNGLFYVYYTDTERRHRVSQLRRSATSKARAERRARAT